MKYFFLLIFTTLSINVMSITSPSQRKSNRQSTLEYHISVVTANIEIQDTLIQLLKSKARIRGLNFTFDNSLDSYPDVVLSFDIDVKHPDSVNFGAKSFVQIKFPYQKKNHTIQVYNLDDASDKVLSYLYSYYYQGLRPVYSTVFKQGEGGYNTYRIPSVMSLPNGRVLAITEARLQGKTDCAENDLILRYSDDEGKSWSDIVLMAEAGKASLNNPTTVFVKELNRILVLFQEYPPKKHEGVTSTGVEGDNITRFYVIYSDDNGESWSVKRDITRQAKLPEATSYASGPGIGIRVNVGPDKGRILIPVNVSGGKLGWFNYLIASDDLGNSWHILPGRSDYGTNESQLIQVSETEFLINARCHRFEGQDKTAPVDWNPWNFEKVTHWRGEISVKISHDMTSWSKTKIRQDMPDPLCQGSIYRYSGLNNNEKSIILFSNPASQLSFGKGDKLKTTPPARINGVVRLSYDNGKTWKWSKRIYGNRFTEFQYSVLTRMASGKIGCFFETGGDLKFALFDLNWLTSGEYKNDISL